MRNRLTLTVNAALVLCGAAALAQAPAPGGPSPEMKKLDFLVGKWKEVTKNGLPGTTPVETQGTMEITWALNGQYLLGRSSVALPGQPAVEGLALVGYDPQTKQYRLWLFGPLAPPEEASGHLEGGKLALMELVDPAPAGGIGISAERTPEGYVRVTGVRPGGAAAQAGLKAGDLITQVDGAPLSPTTPALDLLRGRAGTPVHLTVRSGGQERALTLTRQELHRPPLRVTLEPQSKGEWGNTIEARDDQGRWRKVSVTVYTRIP